MKYPDQESVLLFGVVTAIVIGTCVFHHAGSTANFTLCVASS